ncbi:MAG: pyruvate carboxylase subunit B, partial [Chloroflexi bacterium]|nr:pyruvate carboxylase subunit B [Chloroflexota bacterium]
MGGLLAHYDAAKLVTAMKSVLDVPLQLHTHYTSGMASMTALKAIEAGLDVVDTCLAPLALRTAQPAIEPLIMALSDSDRETGLDLDRILELGDYLESILPKYRQYLESPRAAVIDAKVLKHQIPGGMASNLISQLREADALDRLDEVLEEIPRIREELGYPPLVTPMSQMTGSQAVSNVLFGRYKMVSEQVKDYVLGLYGKSPAPIDSEVVAMALQNSNATPITGRPADAIEPEMDKAKDAIKDISSDIEDALTYAMYPTTGLTFLKIKHGLEPMPEEMKPKTLEQVERERASASQGASKAPSEAPPRSRFSRQFNVYVGEQHFQVEVDPLQPMEGMAVRPVQSARPEASQRTAAPEQTTSQDAAPGEARILAPIPGVVLRYAVEVGQDVAEGDPVVVLEAMKMENTLPAPISGRVKSLPSKPGETVAKDAVLAVISA